MPATAIGARMRFPFLILLLLAACVGPRSVPTPAPERDRIVITFGQEGDQNAFGGATHCDTSGGAQLACLVVTAEGGFLHLEVGNIGGNAYAVWRTDLVGQGANVTDFQALALRLRGQGEGLGPHLYLVDQDGRRAYVDLGQVVGLTESWQEVVVPLPWFRTGDGKNPDFSRLSEFQIVFEWASMSGTLDVDDVRFVHHVRRALALPPVPESVALPPGFTVDVYASGLPGATTITWGPDGHLWLSQQNGNIWRLEDTDGDGRADQASLFASGFTELLGILWHPEDGTLYASSRATISILRDNDGDGRADERRDLLTDLPWGRHQNNGMAWGPDGYLYFGLGSGADVEEEDDPLRATILRLPHLGTREDLEIVARGIRNAYDVAFNARGDLFAADNGPDYTDAPDELNHIISGRHYGYPYAFGDDDGSGRFQTPIWLFPPHASPNGITAYQGDQFPPEYQGNLFVALFGQIFGGRVVGHEVDRVILVPKGETYTARVEPFMTGLDRPLDVTVGADGALYVLEYVDGTVYRVTWQGRS